MIRYPLGIQTFEEIRTERYLYVDKTACVYELVNRSKYAFFTRPRRFGKSLLVSTLDAYFSGKKQLFEGLAIARAERQWEAYPVLRFSLASVIRGTVADLNAQLGRQLGEAERHLGLPDGSQNGIALRLQNLVTEAREKTGKQAVILIDEYDTPLLSSANNQQKSAALRAQLRSFYSSIKGLDAYLRNCPKIN
ncbi:MAG: AAA family ATPase [Succinivibrio sp.]|nr:AAA family ATPase [Succinivibrio sp.]